MGSSEHPDMLLLREIVLGLLLFTEANHLRRHSYVVSYLSEATAKATMEVTKRWRGTGCKKKAEVR